MNRSMMFTFSELHFSPVTSDIILLRSHLIVNDVFLYIVFSKAGIMEGLKCPRMAIECL